MAPRPGARHLPRGPLAMCYPVRPATPNGPMPPDWYEANAASVVPRYEAIDPAYLHGWFRDLLPDAPGAVLDVEAGSGRDAAWLASLGHEMVAVEPSAAMRAEAARLHPDPRIR